MKSYIDHLKTRNKVEYEQGRYYACSYEDYFMGEWGGNLNIFKDGQVLMHATTTRALTEEELKKQIELYELDKD